MRGRTMPSCVEVVAEFLGGAGVSRIYGVPGEGASLDLLEAARGRGIPFVLICDEGSAAIMAATEGELLGRPGVCVTGPGAGAAGAVQGLAQALADRAPLLLFTDRAPLGGAELGEHRRLDHRRLLQGAVKAGATLTAARAARLLSWAWREGCQAPRGPIHLDFPSDEARRPARHRATPMPAPARERPSPSAIRAAARLLTRRGRAVVVAGVGCRESGAARALLELVSHLGAPVLTTPRAKGSLPEDHPLSAGVFVGGRLDGELLAKADCVLVVGLDPGEVPARPLAASATIVSLAEDRAGRRPFRPSLEVVADLAESLGALREALPPAGEWGLASWAGQAGAFRARARMLLAEASRSRSRSGLAPHRVVEVAREICPRETRVVVDSGAHALAVAAFWESYEPAGYLCSGRLSASGYALPAAVAAGLADPSRPLLVFTGDGGLLGSLGALATAAQHQVSMTVVVFADESLNLLRALQEQRGYPPQGTALPPTSIPALAEGLGALGILLEEEEGLAGALREALDGRRLAVIAARVRAAGYKKMLETVWGR